MKYLLSLFVTYICLTSVLFAQDKSYIKITPKDVIQKQPLKEVKCMVKKDTIIIGEFASNPEGEIFFSLPKDGMYKIILKKDSFEAKKINLNLDKDSESVIDLSADMVKSNMYLFRGSIYNKSADRFVAYLPVSIKNLYTGVVEKTKTDEVGLVYYYLQPFQKYEVLTESGYHLNKRAILNTDCGKDGEIKFCLTGFSFESFIDPDYDAKTITGTILLDSLRVGDIFRLEDVMYASGSAELNKESKTRLDFLYNIMKDNPILVVELRSHTDSKGDAQTNLTLSQKRAEACFDYLVAKGIDKERLLAKGYGEKYLINRCADGVACSEQEHQENRRTEFKVIRMKE